MYGVFYSAANDIKYTYNGVAAGSACIVDDVY